MTTTAYLGKQRLRLEDRDLLGQGGEGRVFRAGDLAIKILFSTTDARSKKLAAFPKNLPARVVGPQALVTDAKGNVIGYAMARLDDAFDAHQLASRKWRDAEAIGQNDVLCTFRDLWHTIRELHARQIVVGDLNDGNVALTRAPLTPWLIDADSLQLPGFPCVVAHERFLDPRLYGIDLSRTTALDRASDTYAFAVLLFSALCFVHPFGGAHASYPTLLRRAEARHSVLRGDVKLPHSALRPEILGDDLLAWLSAVFDRDQRSAPPAALLEARFTRCTCGVEHARRVCPICSVQRAVPAAVQTLGRLRVTRQAAPALPEAGVHFEGDWLVRDTDGTRIGQLLEGQTHVATGASLGFAFYRAGLVTMFFLFDTRRGPLRQLTLPHLEGRLVEWSVTFDDAHALFCASTTKNGKIENVAHLVDARGDVLATERGTDSAIVSGVYGRCLAGGAVLVASADGLVLVRADRATRSFVPHRAFPETRDIVPPEAELRIGPGGSVFVITHDETIHLSFEGQP